MKTNPFICKIQANHRSIIYKNSENSVTFFTACPQNTYKYKSLLESLDEFHPQNFQNILK